MTSQIAIHAEQRPRCERHRTASARAPRQQRRLLRLGLVAVLLAILWLIHRPLLSLSARALVVDQPIEDCTFLWLRGDELSYDGRGALEAAAGLYRSKPGLGIVLVERQRALLVREGIVESFTHRAARQLQHRGVPAKAIHIIPGAAGNEWEECRLVGAWLQVRPEARLAVLCRRLESGCLRRVIDSTCPAAVAQRVRMCGLRDAWGDETNWWQSRSGVKEWLFGWLGLLHVAGHGPSAEFGSRFDLAEYERQLRLQLSNPQE